MGAIKTCLYGGNAKGTLLGHQIALTNYEKNLAETPSTNELVWLPGTGKTESSEFMEVCPILSLHKKVELASWQTFYSLESGNISESIITFEDG